MESQRLVDTRTMDSAPASRKYAALLALLALVAFLPSAWLCGWIWDDDSYVTLNRVVRESDGVLRAWIPGATPQYYPLVFVSFWIEHAIVGLDATLYHIDNALLHAISCVCMYFVLHRIRVAYAFWIVAIVAVHPMQAESVAWVTERKNVLSLCFAMMCILAWLRIDTASTRAQRSKWLLISVVLFAAAMLSKTTAVFVPPVLVLIQLWERREITREFVSRVTPYFALGIVGGLHTAYLEKTHVGAVGEEFALTFMQRAELIATNFIFYPLHALLPAEQVFIMPRRPIGGMNDAIDLAGFAALVVSVALVILAAWRWRRNRAPLLLLLWYGAAIFPALGFFDVYPFRFSFVADHFAYAALPAISCVFVLCATRVVRSTTLQRVMLSVVVVALIAQSWRALPRFEDEQTLWTITAEQNPNAWIAHNNLASIALSQAEEVQTFAAREERANAPQTRELVRALATEALERSDRMLETSLDPLVGFTNRAEALRLLGRLEDSLAQTDRMISLTRGGSKERWLRARVLELLQRNTEAATEFALAAQALDGVYRIESLKSAMRLAARQKDVPSALVAARALVQAAPEDSSARIDFGALLLASGAHAEGRRVLSVALASGGLTRELWTGATMRYVQSVIDDPTAEEDEVSAAHRYSDKLVERSGGDLVAKLLLAHMRLRTDDREGARALAIEIETGSTDERVRAEAASIRARTN